MAKSIYDQIADGDELAKVWGGMQDGSVYQESKSKGGKVIEEDKSSAIDTEKVDQPTTSVADTVGNPSFNSIFNSLKSQLDEAQETYEECKDCGDCKKCDKKKGKGYKSKVGKGLFSEDMDEVDELADVDVSPEEVEDIEDTYEEDNMVSVPVALLDELYQYTKDAMGSEDEVEIDQEEFEQLEESAKAIFSPKANGKYKKASVKKYTNDKWRFLTKALGHYAKGSTRSAGKVGRGKLFK